MKMPSNITPPNIFWIFSLTFDYYEHKVIFHQYSIHFNHAQINVHIYKTSEQASEVNKRRCSVLIPSDIEFGAHVTFVTVLGC